MTTTVKTKHGSKVTVVGKADPFLCNGNRLERVTVVIHDGREIIMNVVDLVGYDERQAGLFERI